MVTNSSIFIKLFHFALLVIRLTIHNKNLRLVVASATQRNAVEEGRALIEWIRANGGYVDDRIIIRNKIPGDPSTCRGIFTTKDIAEGEDLCFIPWNVIITAGKIVPEEEYNDDGSRSSAYDASIVDTIFHLLHEMNQGSESHFAPYINFLKSQSISAPSSWSLKGREYLETMIGHIFPSQRYYQTFEWFVMMYGLDSELIKAWFTVATRAMQGNIGNQWLLVPIVDLQNHHSDDEVINTARYAQSGVGFEIRSTKYVTAGSELYTRYWGDYTNFFFEEFGFIEDYPHRWRFDFNRDIDNRDVVEIDEAAMIDIQISRVNITTGEDFHMKWLSKIPSETSSIEHFLRNELIRLERMEHEYVENGNNVPAEENVLIWDYHKALVTAIKQVLNELSQHTIDDGDREAVARGLKKDLNAKNNLHSCLNIQDMSH
jgi:hypothetical protein